VVAIIDARTLMCLVLHHYCIYWHAVKDRYVALDLNNNMNIKIMTKNRKTPEFEAKKVHKGCYNYSLPLDKISQIILETNKLIPSVGGTLEKKIGYTYATALCVYCHQ